MAAERVNPPGNKSVISIHHNSYLDRIMGNSKVKFVEFLRTSPPETRGMRARVLLAPGSMAAMDTPFLSTLSICLAARELDVARFEFDYMAARRSGGKRRPPPRAEALCPEYLNAVGAFKSQEHEPVPLFIGGKSLGGRVATMVAPQLFAEGAINGVFCLGYPFHPPGRPEKLRIAHLRNFDCPMLIVQGDRDPLGTRKELDGYGIEPRIEVKWCQDGDHDLKPRKRSGHTHEGHIAAAADAIAAFVQNCIV